MASIERSWVQSDLPCMSFLRAPAETCGPTHRCGLDAAYNPRGMALSACYDSSASAASSAGSLVAPHIGGRGHAHRCCNTSSAQPEPYLWMMGR